MMNQQYQTGILISWHGRGGEEKKKKKGARVNVSQSVCCILPHTLCEQHLFLLTDEREAEGV